MQNESGPRGDFNVISRPAIAGQLFDPVFGRRPRGRTRRFAFDGRSTTPVVQRELRDSIAIFRSVFGLSDFYMLHSQLIYLWDPCYLSLLAQIRVFSRESDPINGLCDRIATFCF